MRSPSTALAAAFPPAPRPYSIISPARSPSMNTALNAPPTAARGWSEGTTAGCTRTEIDRAVAHPFGHCQRLDDVPQLGRVADIGMRDGGDALAVDVVDGDVGAERQAGQDGGLCGGVVPLDVGRRVGLGQPESLRLGQRLVVGLPAVGHATEDEIGRPVDDAHHPDDPLSGQGLTQRPDHRDGARQRRPRREDRRREPTRDRPAPRRPGPATPCSP